MGTKIKPAEPDRIALQWLLATGLLACLSLALELPLWASAIFVIAVAWRYAIERFHVYRPGRLVRYALAVLVAVAVYRTFDTLFGRDAGLTLLVCLLGLKLLELRSVRDAMFTLFLFYVVVVGGFLFGQTLPGALWALAVVVTSLAALIRLQQVMPARAALRLAGELLVKAVPLLLLLYLLFPRMSGTLWSVPTDAHSGLSGLPDEVSLGTVSNLSLSSQIAFRVDFIGVAPPPARELYWRGLVLWRSDGRTWTRNTPPVTAAPARALGPPVQYRVTLEPSNKPWLLALDLPASQPDGTRMNPSYTLSRAEPVRARLGYTLTSYTRYNTGDLDAHERAAALALPPISPRVRALADDLRVQQHEPAAMAQAVLDYFRRENFFYTLSPPLLGEDPVDQFLFETRRGFCEHYATAFATLMRAAGVPARVVIGYQGGELNPTGDYLVVRQLDAHAWTELWFAGRGWVRVDPTAAVAPERVELGSEAIRRLEAQGLRAGSVDADALARAMDLPWFERAARQALFYWDYTNIAWYRWVVDYQKDRQESFLHALGFETIEWPRVLTILGGACVLVLLAYVIWSRRGPRPDPVQRAYARFCRKLARAGIRRAPHEGPLDFAKRASLRLPQNADVIRTVTEQYLHLRYASEAPYEHGLNRMRRAVRQFSTPRQRDTSSR